MRPEDQLAMLKAGPWDRGECRIRVVDITLPKLLPVELDSLVAAASRLFEHVASGIVSAPLDVRSFLLKKEQDE